MKKKVIIILSIAATLVTLTLFGAVGLLLYLNTDQAGLLIQSQVNNRIPGHMEWQKFRLSLLRGEIEMTDFRIFHNDSRIAAFDKFLIAFDLSALRSKEIIVNKILIENPEFDIRINGSGDLNLAAAFMDNKEKEEPDTKEVEQPFVLPFNIIIKSFNLLNGNIAYISVPDDIGARLKNLDVKGNGNLLEKAATLALNTGRIKFKNADMDTSIERLHLNSAYLEDALSDLNIDIESDAGKVKMSGSVQKLLSEPVLDIHADVILAVEKLMGMLKIQTPPVSGMVSIHTNVQGMLNDPKISCLVNWDNGEILARKIEKAMLDIAMENRICDLKSLEIIHEAGSLSANGKITLDRVFPDGFLGTKRDFTGAAWNIIVAGNDILPGVALDGENIKGISGQCSFKTMVSGTMTHPEATLSLKAVGAKYMDYPSADIKLDGNLKKGRIQIDGLTVSSCGTRLNLSGDVALLNEEGLVPLDDPGLRLDISSDEINIGACLKSLKMLENQGIDGNIFLASHIAGTIKKPEVNLTLKGKDLSGAGEEISGIDLSARFREEKLFLDSLVVAVTENQTIQGSGWMGMNKHFDLSLNSDGINLSRIKQLQKADVAGGVVSCSITAKGNVENPEVSGTLTLKGLNIMGRDFQNFTANMGLKDHYASVLGKLGFDINAGFDLKSKDFKADVVLDNTDLLPWMKLAGVPEISGNTTGKLHVLGNADAPEKAIATADIQKLFVLYNKDISIESGDIRGRTDGETFNVEPFTVLLPENGRITLEADGRIDGKINAALKAELPVALAGLFVQTLPPMKGVIQMDARAGIEKDIRQSDVNAKVTLVDMAMDLPEEMGRLYDINGTVLADINSVKIQDIHGNMDSGNFNLTGKLDLKDFMPEKFNAKLRALAIPVRGVDGLDASLNTDLSIMGNLDASLLEGSVVLVNGEWTQDINVEKNIISGITNKKRVRKGVDKKVSDKSILDTIALNISVKGEKPFVINNNMAYMEIHPDINIQGTAAAPVVSGRSEIDPGTIHYQSNDFELTRGIIDFVNPYAIEPELDIQSDRTVRDWDISLAISGTPEALNFTLSSDPRLDHGDIISLLLRGKTIDELINAEGGTTLSTAGMLSQVAASAVSKNVKSATGLDIFEMGFGNNTDDNGLGDLNVTVGKEITEKMTVKYGTESKDGEMVYKTSAEYGIMDNVSLNGFRDSDGQFGGEVRYRLEFR